jgi:hypothetical protein
LTLTDIDRQSPQSRRGCVWGIRGNRVFGEADGSSSYIDRLLFRARKDSWIQVGQYWNDSHLS